MMNTKQPDRIPQSGKNTRLQELYNISRPRVSSSRYPWVFNSKRSKPSTPKDVSQMHTRHINPLLNWPALRVQAYSFRQSLSPYYNPIQSCLSDASQPIYNAPHTIIHISREGFQPPSCGPSALQFATD